MTLGEIAILMQERDRRYAEVDQEREKALKIKEEADRNALVLAREIQTYKDEKANELREQISGERGLYVTKSELASVAENARAERAAIAAKLEAQINPILTFMASQQGTQVGKGTQQTFFLVIVPGLIVALIVIAKALGVF